MSEIDDLRGTVREFLVDRMPAERVREVMDSQAGFDSAAWDRLATELGVVGMTVPAEFGGADAGFDAAAVVLGELGRTLAPVPCLSHVLAVEAVSSCRDRSLRGEILPGIAAGRTMATIAVADEIDHPVTVCSDGDGWRADGGKSHVLDGGGADLFLLAVRDGEHRGWFAVDRATTGVEVDMLTGYDLTRRQSQCPVRIGGRAAAVR
ncbi:acyl-CoA dehydrogenase [Amycolatopsis acidicola]|uniref:Acyl-CoA dehydrogenase n=1 Tax=Amycolatopsis acidicola TaxID=2596893 RepID=A0A5N0VKI8_9PSEU|nr:acyl-CoA dehydrogenase family protein [Amycolatopsis acidicola]KAA9166023.1 acyl-CoA dehydrogenase [Amycolatopsis acidicola]